jgi:DNA-binding MarR family transcriptional regulator
LDTSNTDKLSGAYALPIGRKREHERKRDRECSPRDSVDALLDSWAARRSDLDFSPVAVVARLGRVRGHLDRELDRVFAEHGLTRPSFRVLVTLARLEEEGGVSQRHLMDDLGLTSGTISVRIDRLVEQDLVERHRDPESKRSVRLALTERGRELFERVAPAHLANEARLLAALSDDDRQQLEQLLRKLLVEFEGSQPPEAPGDRLGLVLAPAHETIRMRESVGLPRVAGLLVHAVEPDTAAAEAGISPGDVLIEANGRELRSASALYAAIGELGNGTLALKLLRGSDHIAVNITLPNGCAIEGRATRPSPRPRGRHTL